MDNAQILRHVDHTLLKAASSWEEIKLLCEEAVAYQTASVCVPSSYVERIFRSYGQKLPICTVVGFPLGYAVTEAKVAEAKVAILAGACEIDMVINIGDVKNGEFQKTEKELLALRKATEGSVLKVIIETCYLTEAEKIELCRLVSACGADYIKTSTGFGTAGATLADILLFKKHIEQHVKIKAAGGIRSKEDMVAYLEAGCDRLGTSSAIKILKGEATAGY